MSRNASAVIPTWFGLRTLSKALAVVALIAGALMVDGPRAVWGQEEASCDVTDLGALSADAEGLLQAAGRWTTEDCDSRFRIDSDAHTYRFEITEPGRVRIDLTSAEGDPYLYLLAEDGSRVADDDEGGGLLNARIEQYVTAGTYLIEATTYAEPGLQPVSTNFNLVVHLVDEEAEQRRSNLKVEAIHTPDQVLAGEPFHVHYRAGNLGGGGLSDVDGSVLLYVVGPGDRAWTAPIAACEERWRAGVSYHSGPQTASAASTALNALTPFEITLDDPGPSWVFVGVVAVDALGQEIGFHGIWRNLTVLSGPTFDPVTVSADGADYEVSAAADSRGLVRVEVSSVADPEADIARAPRAKAIYAAGVRVRVLDGLFERPTIAALRQQHEAVAETEGAPLVVVANPSSHALLTAFADHYASAIATSGGGRGGGRGRVDQSGGG